MRAVLDPNVLIAALLSRTGAPARTVAHWLAGSFDLIVSDALLAELARALSYPKLRTRIRRDEAEAFIDLLRQAAVLTEVAPRTVPSQRSADPGDDYLIVLAQTSRAVLVSGDEHLLALADRIPGRSVRAFVEELDRMA